MKRHIPITLRAFARTHPVFNKACDLAHTMPTMRQASKWLHGRGLAWAQKAAAITALADEVHAAERKAALVPVREIVFVQGGDVVGRGMEYESKPDGA